MDRRSGTSYAEALKLPVSLVSAYLESPIFESDMKAEEAKVKAISAAFDRMDNIIKAINVGSRHIQQAMHQSLRAIWRSR